QGSATGNGWGSMGPGRPGLLRDELQHRCQPPGRRCRHDSRYPLPVAPMPVPQEPAMTLSPLESARVLIVDDQRPNVLMLETLLRQSGFVNVRGITDAREAAATFTEMQPDLVLLDLLMPHLDGYGVIAQLRPLIPPSTFLPILMLTADITPEAK